jgi:hypothetical protein
MRMRRQWRSRWLGSLAAAAAVVSVSTGWLVAAAQAEVPPQFYSNGNVVTTTPVPVTLSAEIKLVIRGEAIVCHDLMSASVWNEGGRGVGQLEALAAGSGCNSGLIECTIDCFATGVLETAELPFEVERRQAEFCAEEAKIRLSECPAAAERKVEVLPVRVTRRIGLPWRLRLIREEREEEPAIVAEIGVPSSGETCYPREIVEGKEVAAQWERVPLGCIRMNVIAPAVGKAFPTQALLYGTLKPRLVNGSGNGLDASRLELGAAAGELASGGSAAPEYVSEGVIKLTGSEAVQLMTAK